MVLSSDNERRNVGACSPSLGDVCRNALLVFAHLWTAWEGTEYPEGNKAVWTMSYAPRCSTGGEIFAEDHSSHSRNRS